jgi:hypothetical protein
MSRVYRKAECEYCHNVQFIAAKGLCRACYSRYKKYGEPKYTKVKTVCTVEGCGSEHVAQGYCELHYRRFIRHGSIAQTRSEDWGDKKSHPLYQSWQYLRRFRRNITCSAWIDDFWQFYEDIGDRPSGNHRLKLVDKTGIYCKENYVWVEDQITLDTEDKREYRRTYAKLHRAKNPEWYRNFSLEKHYGITLTEYNALLEQQNGVCVICGNGEKSIHPNHLSNKSQPLAVDHCHETGKIRGLLCSKCNRTIGLMNNAPELLIKAAEYLKQSNI